ncbi:Crp/Fnr family transcriptional regulator [Rhizobium sp. R72]|uniref:helix-turn-helix domain-containing protein n=1 Tax=unclassified Rhizobium TaxID=2613769 RepID=UPI000B6C4963|nr:MULTISPECIES: helix-turn-helix domain-containing protein [unclassified Rhizobium]OWW04435.1 Crp/Fnr family transcriptional regulator [Rhizobium sp. R72]OWW05492.1 Crp/Fnr family transcriptional regulator [Rhizobium sp. R711]
MTLQQTIFGKRILLVEDDYYAATELASRLLAVGVDVVGPCPNVEDAFAKIGATSGLDGAVLDINLGGEMVFPVADELERLGLPFVFATAYDPDVVPARHADKIVLRKPLENDALAAALSHSSHSRNVSIEDTSANTILKALPRNQLAGLLPFLRQLHLPRGAVIEVANQTVSQVYFPIDCVVSLIAVGAGGTRIETGLIGNEGMTGAGVAIGDERTPHELVNQIDGHTLAIAVGDFRDALALAPDLYLLACRFARSLGVQVSHTALVNGAFDVRRRLARWLLMVDDRACRKSFDLTHDYLAVMLGVRRPSVTEALHVLEGERFVVSMRGRLEIRDRPRLVEYAGEAYGIPEAEHRRLMALPLSQSADTA